MENHPDTLLTPKLAEALDYAITLHRYQARKGSGIPYVSHLLSVCALVLEHGGTETEAIAALLHDAAEDQGGYETLEEIKSRFGEAVADIVLACSDSITEPKPPWRERKEAYISHVRNADSSVALVSAADKLHNARAILADYRVLGDDLWQRFNAGPEDIQWYYSSLARAFGETQAPDALVADLKNTVETLYFERNKQ